MRKLLADLFADLVQLERRIGDVKREIEAIVSREDTARRLMTIPGIGALGATALLAAVGSGRQFQKARDLAAWLGLVPREYSTGGKQKLLGIASGETAMSANFSCMALDPAFGTSTEQEIDWGTGWTAFRRECTLTKPS
jgi:transposase